MTKASDDPENFPAKNVEFEDLLLLVGTKGKKNILTMVMASFTGMVIAMNVFSYQFIGATPDYGCYVEPLHNGTDWTAEQIQNISSPIVYKDGEEKYSSCSIYDLEYSELASMSYDDAVRRVQEWTSVDNKTLPCLERRFEEGDSVVTKWNLVCERRYLYTWTQGGVQLGLLIGSIVMGYLTDRFGRKRVYKYCVVLFLLSGCSSIVSPSIGLYIFLRVLGAAAGLGFYMALFVSAMESCLMKERALVGIYFIIPWALGMMLTSGIALLVTEWRYLQLAISSPVVILLVNFCIIPESPRWLVMNGHHSSAYEVLKSIADANKRNLPEKRKMLEDMKTIEQLNSKESYPEGMTTMEKGKLLVRRLLLILTNKKLRLQTILVFYCWFAAATVYYGVSLSAPGITDNAYLYLFIGGVLELVSYFILLPVVEWLGRRIALIAYYAITSITIFGALLFLVLANKDEYYTVKLILYLTGRFAITSAFQLIWVWTAELYPTKYRSLAVGESSTVARVGSIFSPFINDLLSEVRIWIPAFLFGTFSLLAIFCSYYIKDTTNQNLSESLDEDAGQDNPTFTDDTKKHSPTPNTKV